MLDLQRDFLDADGRLPIAAGQTAEVVDRVRLLLRRAEESGDLIVQVGNHFRRRQLLGNALRGGAAVGDAPGTRWDPRVDSEQAVYLAKHRKDAFSHRELRPMLIRHDVQLVRIAGVFADACVTKTALSALEHGFDVVVVRDAVGSRTDGARDRALSRLESRGVRLRTADSA